MAGITSSQDSNNNRSAVKRISIDNSGTLNLLMGIGTIRHISTMKTKVLYVWCR